MRITFNGLNGITYLWGEKKNVKLWVLCKIVYDFCYERNGYTGYTTKVFIPQKYEK